MSVCGFKTVSQKFLKVKERKKINFCTADMQEIYMEPQNNLNNTAIVPYCTHFCMV